MTALAALPTLEALLNAASALLLATGYVAVRRRRLRVHRACMLGALAASVLFLVAYLVYHAVAGTQHFTGRGLARAFYFALLATHSVFAAAVPPLALATVALALRGHFRRHVRLARWTLPVWLYVSVTGVAVYVMLYGLG